MIIARAVALFHAAISDLSLQVGIAVQSGDEAGDMLTPFLGRSVLELISDEEMFHVRLPSRLPSADPARPSQSGASRREWASMDKNDTVGFLMGQGARRDAPEIDPGLRLPGRRVPED